MTQYRKKPVVVDAFRYTGQNLLDVVYPGWIKLAAVENKLYHVPGPDVHTLRCRDQSHEMVVERGDYIIRGTAGEIYGCKPEIFDKIYEPV